MIRVLGKGNANFILAQIGNKDGQVDNERAKSIYERMARVDQVVVRFRGNEPGCEGCLRITVGTEEECRVVVEKLGALLKED